MCPGVGSNQVQGVLMYQELRSIVFQTLMNYATAPACPRASHESLDVIRDGGHQLNIPVHVAGHNSN